MSTLKDAQRINIR